MKTEYSLFICHKSNKKICGINHVTLYTDDQISSTKAQDTPQIMPDNMIIMFS